MGLNNYLHNSHGQSLVEYCLIIGAIILVIIGLLPTLSGRVNGLTQAFLQWIP